METAAHKKYREKRPERVRASFKKWYEANKKELNARKRERYRQISAHVRQKDARIHSLKTLYGLSQEEYVDMFEAQQGRCAICRRPESCANNQRTAKRLLCVDHDHTTGKVRGLLCMKCNHGLDHANDDILILRAMIAYLEAHNG